jgi:hypothetical protein
LVIDAYQEKNSPEARLVAVSVTSGLTAQRMGLVETFMFFQYERDRKSETKQLPLSPPYFPTLASIQ